MEIWIQVSDNTLDRKTRTTWRTGSERRSWCTKWFQL